MIKGVVFDFGNVLSILDRDAANLAMAAHTDIDAGEVGRLVWDGSIETDSETGLIDSREHFARIKRAIGAESSWSYGEFIEDFGKAILPFPEGEAAVEGVAKLGLRSFILSNTNWIHSRKIFEREILGTIPELHALSFRIGAMKPDPRIWNWLLEHCGLRAQELVYIDDKEAYCEAARKLGFTAHRYHYEDGNLLREIEELL